jgi:hypothetical protein
VTAAVVRAVREADAVGMTVPRPHRHGRWGLRPPPPPRRGGGGRGGWGVTAQVAGSFTDWLWWKKSRGSYAFLTFWSRA